MEDFDWMKFTGRIRLDCEFVDAAELVQAAVDSFFDENGLGVDDIEDILDSES